MDDAPEVEVEEESEFGRGCTYCLGLFLAHEQMWKGLEGKRTRNAQLWYNGASDHFYELEIPEALPTNIKVRLASLTKRVLELGHGSSYMLTDGKIKEEDIEKDLQEAKALLRAIDEHLGVRAIKGGLE